MVAAETGMTTRLVNPLTRVSNWRWTNEVVSHPAQSVAVMIRRYNVFMFILQIGTAALQILVSSDKADYRAENDDVSSEGQRC